MFGHPSLHSRGDSQGLVYPAEIVMHEVQGDGVLVVLQLLGEGIGQPGKPAAAHAQGEVLALNVAGGDVLAIRRPLDGPLADADALGRGIPALTLHGLPEELDEHGIVNLSPKGFLHSLKVGLVAVAGQLDAVNQPGLEIVNKVGRAGQRAVPNVPGGHELGRRVNGHPCPGVAQAGITFELLGNVGLFAIGEAPNFIHLDSLAW